MRGKLFDVTDRLITLVEAASLTFLFTFAVLCGLAAIIAVLVNIIQDRRII